jgi:hypothetical protein
MSWFRVACFVLFQACQIIIPPAFVAILAVGDITDVIVLLLAVPYILFALVGTVFSFVVSRSVLFNFALRRPRYDLYSRVQFLLMAGLVIVEGIYMYNLPLLDNCAPSMRVLAALAGGAQWVYLLSFSACLDVLSFAASHAYPVWLSPLFMKICIGAACHLCVVLMVPNMLLNTQAVLGNHLPAGTEDDAGFLAVNISLHVNAYAFLIRIFYKKLKKPRTAVHVSVSLPEEQSLGVAGAKTTTLISLHDRNHKWQLWSEKDDVIDRPGGRLQPLLDDDAADVDLRAVPGSP